jgi:CRP/FNR family cyclic AMP-dependent transcriptional regulator
MAFAPCAWANSTAAGCWHRKPAPWIWCRPNSSAKWTRARLSSSAEWTAQKHPHQNPQAQAFCIFEFIYFARPDSTFFGHNVYLTRKAHGRRLAQEAPVEADLVMPFPDSGTYAALGYSEGSGIPFEMGMIRNHYVGRTFIQPTQSMRDFGVRVKLNPIKELLKGKDIIIIEDSIIRGTTAKDPGQGPARTGGQTGSPAGQRSGPPVPCHYGIDFSTHATAGHRRLLMIESKYLKENIENIQRLMSIQALKHFETRNLGKLLRLSKIRQYEDGEQIIQEGDMDPWLYFLLSGKIRISKENENIGTINRKGEIFGEMRIIDDQSRSASVYAVGETVCLAVDTSAGNRLTSSQEKDERLDFLLLLYRIFAEYITARLRLTNEELVRAKRDAKHNAAGVAETQKVEEKPKPKKPAHKRHIETF